MKKCILVIGVRKKCYRAALELGYDVVLWSDGELKKSRKKNLLGWIEEPYLESSAQLSKSVIEQITNFNIFRVIANTEETVVLGARVREHLDLKRLAVNVTQRFHNKWVMKNFAQKCDVPITKYKLIEQSTKAQELEDHLGYPLVIKPVDESGAQDVKIAKNRFDLEKFMVPGLLAESFVQGTEISVETFVQNGEPIFHNFTQYLHQWRKSVIPAPLEKDLKEQILRMNDLVVKEFGVDRGMTHAEFYLTKEGPVFGEIAIRPPGGYYMDLIERVYGFDPWKLYVKLGCEDLNLDFNPVESGCAGVFIIHPGAGKVKAIDGIDKIKEKVSGIFEFSIRVKVGETIQPHENTSNEVGHILFWAKTREKLDEDLRFIEDNLVFQFFD